MRIEFLEPQGKLDVETVWSALSLVMRNTPRLKIIEKWTRNEMLMAYDWAMREYLSASDNTSARRVEKPWFLTAKE